MSLTNKQTITWSCDACTVKVVVAVDLGDGCQSMIPCLPEGWRRHGALHFCKDHVICLAVDNMILEQEPTTNTVT